MIKEVSFSLKVSYILNHEHYNIHVDKVLVGRVLNGVESEWLYMDHWLIDWVERMLVQIVLVPVERMHYKHHTLIDIAMMVLAVVAAVQDTGSS